VDEKQTQLEWEARAGRFAAVGALLTAALIIGTIGYRIAAVPTGANNVAELLPQVHAHKTPFVIYGVLTGLSMLAFIIPLYYLFRATRFRRPELPNVTRILIIVGPILVAIAAVWGPFRQAHAADQFVAGAIKTKKHAQDLVNHSTTTVAAISLPAALATAIGVVLVSLHAMRAGLLSRFMGILGVILGGLFVIPLAPVPIVQLFWVLALGALYLGFWPGAGRGPAWETGEAEPWPSAQGRFAAPGGAADSDGDDADVVEADAAPTPNPRSSRKRKKKKARR
jgi:hypothetical protein